MLLFKVLCHMLERLGLEVDQVQDGQEAVDAFISHEISGKDKYSGLLLDVMMPGLRFSFCLFFVCFPYCLLSFFFSILILAEETTRRSRSANGKPSNQE